MAVRIETQAEPIPGYRLIERLGGGGFGEVWRAEAPGGLHKAIKFVFGDLSSADDNSQRAEQELKALSRVKTVRHPYILSLERYDIIDGQLIIVMELADRNLWDRFKECRVQGLPGIPRDELLGYMEESAEALDLMNSEYQLQHLDIKPQNLFLVYQHVKVADFGLVKDLEGTMASVTGGVTPVYAAPETFDGKVTRFSDQYSLAIVYQELLTGQRPFTGTNVRQLILQHLQAKPNVSPLPAADQPVIARALSKAPEERFPTCREMVQALRAASPRPAPAEAPPPAAPGPGAPAAAAAVPAETGTVTLAPAPAGTEGPPSGGPTHSLRPGSAPEVGTRTAPPEVTGNGALFPAVVIGLGQLGMAALHALRAQLHAHVGGPGALPNVRTLLIDTDPEVTRAATRAPAGALAAGEVLLAPLNRPSYYLKPREGRPALDSWFNMRMLYRIPRSQVPAGVRALGRLAFCDHYRTITRRVQAELEAALEPAALTGAAERTGMGLRTNRPRVYVLTGLAGGTGGGMFLDLAYTARAALRQMGYDPPDVVGVLLLPTVDGARTRLMTLGNTYAALTELAHYGAPATKFTARYLEREPAVQDREPPFSRCVLLPLPDEGDEPRTRKVLELCGEFLYRDLCTPLGRAADLGRAGLTGPPWESRGLYYQTFGLSRLSWPRQALVERVARRLCRQLVQRWLSKDSAPVAGAVQEWVQQQWSLHELGADTFIQRLQSEAVRQLGRPAETSFNEVLARLAEGPGEEGKAKSSVRVPVVRPAEGKKPPDSTGGWLRRVRTGEGRNPSPEEVTQALKEMEALVGAPAGEGGTETTGSLEGVVRAGAERLAGQWSQKLAELSVQLIEEPAFRLAGAEEAVRRMVAILDQTLEHHEPLARDLAAQSAEARARLLTFCTPGSKAGVRLSMADAQELLRTFAKSRYQALVLHHLAASLVGLRGNLSDELREINFCRVRLRDLARLFEEAGEPAARPVAGAPGGRGRELILSGFKDLDEALQHFLGEVGAEELLELDGRVEQMLKKRFTALVHVCLSTTNLLKNVEEAMLETARQFAGERVPSPGVADLFFEQHPEEEDETAEELVRFYEEAAPLPVSRRSLPSSEPEFSVLAAPPGPAGERLRQLFRDALPRADVYPAPSAEDVVLYREKPHLYLADLEQLGPAGRDAYAQMSAAANFTPHTRTDVEFKLR